jgi:NitT/TauT family transport system substrate-binding protein
LNTRRRAFAASAIALMALFTAACGGSGAAEKGAGGLEKSNIKVGVLSTWDNSTTYLAINKGFFKAEGLNVTPVILVNGDEAVTRSMSNAVDFTNAGDISPIAAASKGVKLKIVVDGSQAKPNMYVIVTPPKSSIHTAKDLAGKKIAVTNTKGLPAMLTNAALQVAGVDPKSVHLVEVPYPNMGAAIQRGSVDAAFATDPFLTRFEQTLGVRVVLDTISGPTADFPIGCFITSQKFAKQNPKTVAAYQRAMAKAQALAASNRNEVAQVMPGYIKGLTPQLAQAINLGTFSTSMSKARIQRVADFMTAQKAINGHFDVQGVL